ncbi:HlyC/CorC family transporter [bacterium]|nr:HlyC/CorC family transporter [bacterium]
MFAGLVLLFAAIVLYCFGQLVLLSPVLFQASSNLEAVLGGLWARMLPFSGALGNALLLALFLAFLGAWIATVAFRSERWGAALVRLCVHATDLLTFRLKPGNGTETALGPERKKGSRSPLRAASSNFEITMASGEEVEAEEREYIGRILELGETTVREVMKPRTDVVALNIDWSQEKVVSAVVESTYSRFPVYEGSIDNVIGVLHLRDLLEYFTRTQALRPSAGVDLKGQRPGTAIVPLDLRSVLMKPKFIPESKKVDDALRELQAHRGHLALVLDEFGGTAGIVTVEDLLEEIVGEIQDEYDEESKLIHKCEDGSYLVNAQLPLNDFNELLNTNLEAEDVDTLGGFVAAKFGRIPQAQDSMDVHGLRLTVLSMEKNRIGRMKVERL